jgi:hypothetical protein
MLYWLSRGMSFGGEKAIKLDPDASLSIGGGASRRSPRLRLPKGRTRGRGAAGCYGGFDPGRDVGRPDDVCADRRCESVEPPR